MSLERPGRAGRRVALAFALASTLLGAALLAWWLSPLEELPLEPGAVELAAGPAMTAPVMAGDASAAAEVAAAARPASDTSPADKEFVEVCGLGKVRRGELEDSLQEDGEAPSKSAWAQALDRQAKQGLADVLKRLDAGSLKQRVAAAVLRADVQAAAELAASTDDAAAYRIALRACRRDSTYRSAYPYASQQQARLAASVASGVRVPEPPVPGPIPVACAALNLERLELLDPGDAWPWLLHLEDAHGDAAAISQALYQLAQRRRLSANTHALVTAMAGVIGTEPTPGETWALVSAMGVDGASMTEGSLLSVGRACRPDALRDANRRQLCEQVVRRAPDMALDVMASRMLHTLEERLGLPHSPKALSREEADRAQGAIAEVSMRWAAEPTCAHVGGMGRHLVKLAREGELAVIKAYLKTTPASAPH
ncbi:hypothetical protein [Roseateles sp.]|uniref:hypothetical protein n=1 Tax=Roseateles sp. TaxID=1971397 RepID=UPI0039ED5824